MSPAAHGSVTARAAAIGLLALALGVAWLLLVRPVVAVRQALDEELGTTRAFRERFYARTIVTGFGRPDPTLLAASTAAVAAAVLQTQLQAMIEDAGGTIERLEAAPLPARRGTPRLDAVRAAAVFTGTTAQLREVMLAIERAPTAMVLDDLAVRTAAATDIDEARTGEDRLRVEPAVRAFRLRGGPR